MAVAANIICAWTGAHASLPTGWSRETDLDGKYVIGATGDGGGTGGSTTHEHTSVAHTHTITISNSSSNSSYPLGRNRIAKTVHTHGLGGTLTSNSATVIIQAASNDPEYVEVIWIKSDGTNDIPDDCLAFFEEETPPTDWVVFADTKDKFLKGAGTGADAGGTGGSATHTHTATNHTHAAKTSAAPTVTATNGGGTGTQLASSTHTHNFSIGSTSTTVSTDNGEPTFYKLSIVQNTTGGDDLPDGIICLWIDAEADIPDNWTKVDAMDDYFCKGWADNGDSIGDTGGGSAHNHTSTGHTGTVSHTSSASNNSTNIGPGSASINNHTHSDSANSRTNVINNCTSEANYPEYVEAIFIKYTAAVVSDYYHVMVMNT